MEKGEKHPALKRWLRANVVARTQLPDAEAALVTGDTIRKLPGKKVEQLTQVFTLRDESRLAQDLIILGVCIVKTLPAVELEYDPPILLCDTLVTAKKSYPDFFRVLFNRSVSHVYSVWEVALKAACQRSEEKNKGVGKSLMEIIGAASEIIEMDEFRRLPHLYAGLPDELS